MRMPNWVKITAGVTAAVGVLAMVAGSGLDTYIPHVEYVGGLLIGAGGMLVAAAKAYRGARGEQPPNMPENFS